MTPDPTRITRERGPMTRQVRDAVLRAEGEAGWQALLATVSPACRERFLKPVGYFEWVESELALELHEAWRLHQGQESMGQRGRDAALEILGGAHRWLLKVSTPGFLVQAFPKLFAFYYQGGRVEVEALTDRSARICLWGSGYPEAWFREGVSAWAQVALEMTGAQPSVRYEPPADTAQPHRYHITW
jgi:hypothetical protein